MSKNKILFCFPYAGGTAAFYDDLAKQIESDVKIVALEYPGHGKRFKETLCTSFTEVVDDAFAKIVEEYGQQLKEEDTSFSLMGYSMGSIAAVELLKRFMSSEDLSNPKHVFLAAHEPYTLFFDGKAEEIGLDEFVKEHTISFGGIDEQLLNNKSFWRMYLPLYRADYLMIANYSFEALELDTDIPATVFYSEEDTKFEDMKNWKKYFTDSCEFFRFDGTHFFIKNHLNEIGNIICERFSK